jgi:hypothetical protein
MGLAKACRPDHPSAEEIMWINYGAQMLQSPAALLALEKHLRGRPIADRVTLLRWLKTRTIRRLRAAAPVLGYRERPLQRWWAT